MPSRPDDPTQPLPSVPTHDADAVPGTSAAAPAPQAAPPVSGDHQWATAVTPDAAAAAPAVPAAATATAPAVKPPRWSGRKTAVAAALAVGLAVGGAAGATTAFALGRHDGRGGETSQLGPGGSPGQGQLPGAPGGRSHDGDRDGGHGRDGDGDGPGRDQQPGGSGGSSSTNPGDANGTSQTT